MSVDRRFSVHLCLVSDQVTANLAPASAPDFRPDKVILATTPAMQPAAFHLETVLGRQQVACERWTIDDPYDYAHVRDRVETLLDELGHRDVTLNVTGGTKIMAFAAQRVFLEQDLPIFYVNPRKDEILWLHPAAPPRQIVDQLSLDDFLNAHGFHVEAIERQPIPAAQLAVAQELIRHVTTYAPVLGTLNFLAGTAEKRPGLISDPLRPPARNRRDLNRLIDLVADHGLLKREEDILVFPDEASRYCVNGGWLESLLYATLAHLGERLPLQDLARNVQMRAHGGSQNEIDIALLRNNQFHLIECKTRRFLRDRNGQGGGGSDTLYKLDSLRDAGGDRTRTLLVSYQQLSFYDRLRARDLKIFTLVGEQLRNLEYELLTWLKQKEGAV